MLRRSSDSNVSRWCRIMLGFLGRRVAELTTIQRFSSDSIICKFSYGLNSSLNHVGSFESSHGPRPDIYLDAGGHAGKVRREAKGADGRISGKLELSVTVDERHLADNGAPDRDVARSMQ